MLSTLRRALRMPGFAAVTASLLPLYLADDARTPRDAKRATRDAWTRRWSRALLRLFSIEVEAHGTAPPPKRGRLVVMNHRSAIDTGVALSLFGGVMVSRADLAQWPVLGIAARKTGTLFVDRAASSSGAALIRIMRDALRSGETVVIFPEGTTFADDEVHPFHGGAFVAALHSGADILPVGLAYETGSGAAFLNETFLQHLHRMAGAPATRVAVVVGEPFTVPDDARATALKERAQAEVQTLVHEARRRVDRR